MLAILLPGVRPGPIHVALLARDALECTGGRGRGVNDPMQLAEACGYLFSSRCTQITLLYTGEDIALGCYGSVVMLPCRGPALLRNIRHRRDTCFSPVLKAMVLHLRAAMGFVDVHQKQVVLRDSESSGDHAEQYVVHGPRPDQQQGRARPIGKEGLRE